MLVEPGTLLKEKSQSPNKGYYLVIKANEDQVEMVDLETLNKCYLSTIWVGTLYVNAQNTSAEG